MSSATIDIPSWTRPTPTQEVLDYAPLALIDLSKFWTPEGKQELVQDLRHSLTEVGFFYAVGHGISDEEVDRQFSIANAFFNLSSEEKGQHLCDFKVGNYFGYREPGRQLVENSKIKNNIAMLNIPKFTPAHEDDALHNDFVQALATEIQAFQEKVHHRILDPLYRLTALLLELPEDYFSAPHGFEKLADDHLRYLCYKPNPKEIDAQIKNQYAPGHSDFGTFTLLFPQVVAGLQIQVEDGVYKHVAYKPGHVVVNTAEILTYVTAGYIKSTIHRVIRAPEDQTHVNRIGVIYFARVANDFEMQVAPSPLLQRLGLFDPSKVDPDPPKGLEWSRARVKHFHDKPVQDYVTPFNYKGKVVETYYNSPDPLKPATLIKA